MATKFEWVMSPQQRKSFQSTFANLAQQSGQNAVTGEQLKSLVSGKGLPTTTLAQIWSLSAQPGNRTLGEEEFLICSFLVGAAMLGVPLPDKLPKELLKSIKKTAKDVSSSGHDEVPSSDPITPPATASSPTLTKVRSGRVDGQSPDKRKSATLRSSGSVPSDQAPSPGSGKRVKSKWALSKEEKKRYLDTFASHNAEGFINGEKAVRLFTMSGLPQKDLAYIWALSDMDRDRQLSQQEFLMAMHLITRRMKGEDLPATIPTALVLSASSDVMSSKKPKGLNRAGQSSGVTRSAAQPTRSVSMYSASPDSPNSGSPQSRRTENPKTQNEEQNGTDASFTSGMLRSASTTMARVPGNTQEYDHSFNGSSPSTTRQPIAARSSSGILTAGSYSASELPSMDSLLHGSNRGVQSNSNLRPPTLMSIAAYGVDEKITPEYDASADLLKLEQITDLATVKMILAQLTDEVKSMALASDRLQLQQESLNDKLATRVDQNSMSQRRRSNFETILRNYNQQLDADVGLYESLKAELNEISADIDTQQQQLNSPQNDIHQLREKRRHLISEYSRVKADSIASHEEHTRLVLEVEKLRLEGTDQAGKIDTNWSDHGFKEEPALAFGDSDYASGSRTSSATTFTPSFKFKPASFGSSSGTMTPTIDEFDFNDTASEAGDDSDLAWLKSDPTAPSTSSSLAAPGSDFFAAESANWADFSVQEDERRRERVVSSVSKEKRPGSKKLKTDSPKSPSEKKKKKPQH